MSGAADPFSAAFLVAFGSGGTPSTGDPWSAGFSSGFGQGNVPPPITVNPWTADFSSAFGPLTSVSPIKAMASVPISWVSVIASAMIATPPQMTMLISAFVGNVSAAGMATLSVVPGTIGIAEPNPPQNKAFTVFGSLGGYSAPPQLWTADGPYSLPPVSSIKATPFSRQIVLSWAASLVPANPVVGAISAKGFSFQHGGMPKGRQTMMVTDRAGAEGVCVYSVR